MEPTNINLCWDYYPVHLLEVVQSMYNSEKYCDCTLTSADNFSFDCHRMVLSSISPFLKNIIEEHPLERTEITLAGVSKRELCAVIEYMYTGETTVSIEGMPMFLAVCKELEISSFNECFFLDKDVVTEIVADEAVIDANLPESQGSPAFDTECEIKEETTQNAVLLLQEAIELAPGEDSWIEAEELSELTEETGLSLTSLMKYENKPKAVDYDTKNSLIQDLGATVVRRYQCKKCSNRYSHRRTLLHHIHWICNQPATYACTLCSYRGKRKFQLTSHLERFHSLKSRKRKKLAC